MKNWHEMFVKYILNCFPVSLFICKDCFKPLVYPFNRRLAYWINPLVLPFLTIEMDRKFNKFIPNTQMLTFHALKHSLSSAANWSSALGGPRISTIKRARINILPFIDSENLAAHIRQYKEILKKYNNVLDFSKVPLQVSFDATAVTGRFQSRKLQSRCSDYVDRIIYGVTTPSGPLQKT